MSSYIDDLTYRTITDGYNITFPTRKNVVFNGATILDDPRNDRTIVYVGAGETINLTLGQILSNGNNALTKKIVNLGNPTYPQDATTKVYVDGYVANNIYTSLLNYTTKNYVDGYISLYLPLSGGTMSGDINAGGNDIYNFRSDGIDGYSLLGGSKLTEVFQYSPILPDGYGIGTIGIRVIAWELASKTVSGVAETLVTIRSDGTSISILGSPVWDKTSQGFPSTFDLLLEVDSINTDSLSIYIKPGLNNSKCNIYCWLNSFAQLTD